MTPLSVLRKHWGYTSFRPAQAEIIDSVLAGNDTLALLPTGGGKSITFQVPALMLPGLTLVVTPLISLMKDQVDNLYDIGIRASCLYSGLTRRETNNALDRCAAGRSKLLYVSPERLTSKTFLTELAQLNVSLIVVDEAHCISQWGYDFRPSYLKIAQVRKLFPKAPVLAVTASATPRVADDIMEQLQFRGRAVFRRSFTRPNISYIVRREAVKEPLLERILSKVPGTAIVYVRSRKRTREVAEMLRHDGFSADFYHAGLDPADKADRQNRWKDGSTRVMVATNAFGMGIDKPDVRLVVHLDLPSSLEEYYQEAGRAGRDGKPSFAVLLVSPYDKATLRRRVSEAFPPKDFVSKVYEQACVFANVGVGDGFDRVYEFDTNRFLFQNKLTAIPTRAALGLLTRAGYLEYSDDINTRAAVMVIVGKQELYDQPLDSATDAVLQTLLRRYTGLFADYVAISEGEIARHTSLTEQQVYDSLLTLTRMHLIHYIPKRTLPYIYFPTSREETRYIQLPKAVYDDRKEGMKERIAAMERFAFDAESCRVKTLLGYFGDSTPEDEQTCSCDVCRSRRIAARPVDNASIEQSMLYVASQPGHGSLDYLLDMLAPRYGRVAVIEAYRRLKDEGRLQ